MPEVIIKYKDKKTLRILQDIAKYFNFSVIMSESSSEPEKTNINGVTLITGDSSIDTSDLEAIFSDKNIDSKQLRKEAWQRN